MSHPLIWRRLVLWLLLQPATRATIELKLTKHVELSWAEYSEDLSLYIIMIRNHFHTVTVKIYRLKPLKEWTPHFLRSCRTYGICCIFCFFPFLLFFQAVISSPGLIPTLPLLFTPFCFASTKKTHFLSAGSREVALSPSCGGRWRAARCDEGGEVMMLRAFNDFRLLKKT